MEESQEFCIKRQMPVIAHYAPSTLTDLPELGSCRLNLHCATAQFLPPAPPASRAKEPEHQTQPECSVLRHFPVLLETLPQFVFFFFFGLPAPESGFHSHSRRIALHVSLSLSLLSMRSRSHFAPHIPYGVSTLGWLVGWLAARSRCSHGQRLHPVNPPPPCNTARGVYLCAL